VTNRGVLCLIASLLLTAAAGAGQPKTDRALDHLATAFSEAFNAKDAARVAAFYAEDAIVMPPDQPMIRGRSEIEAYYTRGFRSEISGFHLAPLESAVIGGRAYEVGTSTLTEQRGTSDGKYVVIYRRVRGEWKIAYDIFNND
jgi:uncharacterized protein (TIGR02246 family)